MTEKRFELILYDNSVRVKEVRDNGKVIYPNEIVDLLNELVDKNEQLQKDCTALIYNNQEYRKENKQLKQSIKEVVELLSEEVDVFSEKATEHDIIAYRELNKLDNKDAYYMATATKKAIRMLRELMR